METDNEILTEYYALRAKCMRLFNESFSAKNMHIACDKMHAYQVAEKQLDTLKIVVISRGLST